MAQLRQDHDKFIAQDTEVVVVGPEGTEAIFIYLKQNKLPFIGLFNPTHTVLKRYGQEVNLFKLGRQPTQVTIDKDGQVRFVHYGYDPNDIPSNEEILTLLKEINERAYASY
jgi:peroxiredoxin Q/BCP